MQNPKVTPEEIFERLAQRTSEAVAGRHVLLIDDTSEINYQSKQGRKQRLGIVGNGTDIGLFVHPVLAVDGDDGSVLGLAAASIWKRTEAKKKNYSSLPIEQKESYRWIKPSQQAIEALKDAASVTEIKDREGDIYEAISRPRPDNAHFVIRAAQNRKLADGSKTLSLDRIAAEPEAGTISFEAPARLHRKGRLVTLGVRFTEIEVKQSGNDKRFPGSIKVNIVQVREIDPPSKKEAICWTLLTSHTVESLDDAIRIVGYYRKRWTIEQLFRSVKSQSVDIEESLVEDADDLKRLVSVALIAAVKVMQLVHARGEAGHHLPAERVFSSDEIQVIESLIPTQEGKTAKQKNPHPRGSLARAAWSIARLGGWTGYATERPPGPITFVEGLRRLDAIVQGFFLAKARN